MGVDLLVGKGTSVGASTEVSNKCPDSLQGIAWQIAAQQASERRAIGGHRFGQCFCVGLEASRKIRSGLQAEHVADAIFLLGMREPRKCRRGGQLSHPKGCIRPGIHGPTGRPC